MTDSIRFFTHPRIVVDLGNGLDPHESYKIMDSLRGSAVTHFLIDATPNNPDTALYQVDYAHKNGMSVVYNSLFHDWEIERPHLENLQDYNVEIFTVAVKSSPRNIWKFFKNRGDCEVLLNVETDDIEAEIQKKAFVVEKIGRSQIGVLCSPDRFDFLESLREHAKRPFPYSQLWNCPRGVQPLFCSEGKGISLQRAIHTHSVLLIFGRCVTHPATGTPAEAIAKIMEEKNTLLNFQRYGSFR